MAALALPRHASAAPAAADTPPRLLAPVQETAFAGVFRNLANGTLHSKITKFEASGAHAFLNKACSFWSAAAEGPRCSSCRSCARRSWLLLAVHLRARHVYFPTSSTARGAAWPTPACLSCLPAPAGVARVQGEFYVVFDNSMALGHLDDRFGFRWAAGHGCTCQALRPRVAWCCRSFTKFYFFSLRDPHNVLVGPWEPESQFEGGLHACLHCCLAHQAAALLAVPRALPPAPAASAPHGDLAPASCPDLPGGVCCCCPVPLTQASLTWLRTTLSCCCTRWGFSHCTAQLMICIARAGARRRSAAPLPGSCTPAWSTNRAQQLAAGGGPCCAACVVRGAHCLAAALQAIPHKKTERTGTYKCAAPAQYALGSAGAGRLLCARRVLGPMVPDVRCRMSLRHPALPQALHPRGAHQAGLL